MCRFLMRLVACAIAATVLVLASPGKPRADVDEAKQLIVMIEGKMRGEAVIGAGIIIGSGADRLYIATANHVVRQGTNRLEQVRVRLKFLPGEDVKAEILRDFDRTLDLAVLRVKGVKELAIAVDEIPFRLLGAADELKRGDAVFSIGYPRGVRWQVNVSPDRISENLGDSLAFESQLVANGHSGGGLFNKDWALVGMITADQPPNGVATRIDGVLEQLRRWGYPVKLTRQVSKTPLVSVPPNQADQPPIKSPQEILKNALADYDAVQAAYRQAKARGQTCGAYRRIVEKIRLYIGNPRLVPERSRYSVRYPSTKVTPTISDLATDRILRIKNVDRQCFSVSQDRSKKKVESPPLRFIKLTAVDPQSNWPKNCDEIYLKINGTRTGEQTRELCRGDSILFKISLEKDLTIELWEHDASGDDKLGTVGTKSLRRRQRVVLEDQSTRGKWKYVFEVVQ